jgi:hypothetical protein
MHYVQFRCSYILPVLAIAALSLVGPTAQAHTYCIAEDDAPGLQAALAEAANNSSEDDTIQLQGGHFSIPTNFLLAYMPTSSEQGDLTIEGGYGPNFGNACGTPPATPDARVTVLEGGLWRARLSIGGGSLFVKSTTIRGAFSTDAIHAPIEISADSNANGSISFQNVILAGNGSTATSAIYLATGAGLISLDNTVLNANSTFALANPVHITSSSGCAYLSDSTVVGNISNLPAISFDVNAVGCVNAVINDIFWANTPGGGISISNPQNTYALNDDLSDVSEVAGTISNSILSLDPLFNSDLSLKDLSPLRDRGIVTEVMTSAFDVGGQPRIYHDELPDIGAFEIQDVIFANGLDVSF